MAKHDARPDLKTGGRILLTALAAGTPTARIQLNGAGIVVINLVVGGMLYLSVYLTLAPIFGAVEKQDILNLRPLLGGTRTVTVLVNPILDYEFKLVSAIRRS